MLISKKVTLSNIISNTWKNFLADLMTCTAAYLVNTHVLIHHIDYPPLIPTILGTALAFFIGFNNNQAYDRWWEARKIWGGIVNDSRSWARNVIYYTHKKHSMLPEQLSMYKDALVKRHIAFLYALKDNLRSAKDRGYTPYLNQKELERVEGESNKHNAILSLQAKDIQHLYDEGVIDGFQFLELNKMIVRFSDEMGKSERIKNTVFPTTYNYYTKVFTWIFIVSVTIVTADYVGSWSIIFGTLIGYIFLTTHNIGQALLDPFDDIPTGVPLNQITRTIEINLLEMLEEKEIPTPITSNGKDYVM